MAFCFRCNLGSHLVDNPKSRDFFPTAMVLTASSSMAPSMLLRSGKHMLEDNPTIIVAGPSTPGGTSRTLSAYKREFPLDVSNQSFISYTQYRGIGVPLSAFGEPGDLFIDLSPGASRVFVRYRSWREWLGIHEDVDTSEDPPETPLAHPRDPTRVVWCTQTDVVWYKITAVRLAKIRLFSAERHRGVAFIPAHDLIPQSFVLSEETDEGHLLTGLGGPNPKRRRMGRSPALDARDEVHVHPILTSVHDTISSSNPERSASTSENTSISVDSDEDDEADDDRPLISEDTQVIVAQDRHFESPTSEIIHYTQYRSRGSPPPDLGRPGDMYIDTSPEAYRLFAKYESWKEWTGVHRVQPPFRFPHPRDRDRQLWVTQNDVVWYRLSVLWHGRKRVLSSTTESFISAHTMIENSGFLKQNLKPAYDKDDGGRKPPNGRATNRLIELRKGTPSSSDSDKLDDIRRPKPRLSTSPERFRKKRKVDTPKPDNPPTNPPSFPYGRDISPLSPLPSSPDEMINNLPPPTSPNPYNYWDIDHAFRQYTEDPYAMPYSPEIPRPHSSMEDRSLRSDTLVQNTSLSWPFDEYLEECQLNFAINTPPAQNLTIDPRTLLTPSFREDERVDSQDTPISLSSHPSINVVRQTPSAVPLLATPNDQGGLFSPLPQPPVVVVEQVPLSLGPHLDLREMQNLNRSLTPPIAPSGQAAPKNTIHCEDTNSNHLNIMSRTRVCRKANLHTIRYKQYRGYGPPPASLGNSSDMYFDTSLAGHRLFVKYAKWREWLGIYRTATPMFEHPKDTETVVWCSRNDVSWYKRSSTAISRARLFEKRNVPFVPAHTLIKRSCILDELDWSMVIELLNENTHEASMSSSGTGIYQPHQLKQAVTGSNPPLQATPDRLPTVQPIIPVIVTQVNNGPLKVESDVIKTMQDVNDVLKTQESLKKRRGRNQQRMVELNKRETELASQEETMLKEEQRVKEGLERATRYAVRLQDRAKQLEEELLLERESILTKEVEISQREKALQQRQKLIAEMEGRIDEWEHI